MVSLTKLLIGAFVTPGFTEVLGFLNPTSLHELHSTRRSVNVGDKVVVAYHPPSTFETFGIGIDHPLSKRPDSSLADASVAFVAERLGRDESTIAHRTGFLGEVSDHAYLNDEIPFSNAVANIAFNKNNKVVSFGSSFVNPKSMASSTPSVTLADAIPIAEKVLNGSYNGHLPRLEYFAKADGTAALTHVIQIRNYVLGTWFEAFIDAHSGGLVSVTNFVAEASYLVLPIQKETLIEGFETLVDPQDTRASPNGWHSTLTTGGPNSNDTTGNNAQAYKYLGPIPLNLTTAKATSDPLNFIYTQKPDSPPSNPSNANAACVNAFYLVNRIHDITYLYGFTEAAYNFQANNYGNGGTGGDPVKINVQDLTGTDNANFATPADGQSGQMRMFIWDYTIPNRDGALENDIPTHEMTHGITNRMTGGGTGACLTTTEAGGMGEGWSDAMADWMEKTSSAVPDFFLGQYVTNNPAGIRSHPYSTDPQVNPLRYSDLKTKTEVHDIGEVWANILHNVYAALVAALGWSATSKSDPSGTKGNVCFLHQFLDALSLQPCNPTFVNARDAWIQADIIRYGGMNYCLLWKAFASRGLGVGAANYTDSSAIPSNCTTIT